MKLFFDLSCAFVAGFVGHVALRPAFKRDFGNGWLSLVSYTSGALLTLPFVVLIFNRTDRKGAMHLMSSYLLAYLGVGSGVAAGYYFVSDKEMTR